MGATQMYRFLKNLNMPGSKVLVIKDIAGLSNHRQIMIFDFDNCSGKEQIYEKKFRSGLENYQINGDNGRYLVGTYCGKMIICLPYEGQILKLNNDAQCSESVLMSQKY